MIEAAWVAGLVAILMFVYFAVKIVGDFRARRWGWTTFGVLIGLAASYILAPPDRG